MRRKLHAILIAIVALQAVPSAQAGAPARTARLKPPVQFEPDKGLKGELKVDTEYGQRIVNVFKLSQQQDLQAKVSARLVTPGEPVFLTLDTLASARKAIELPKMPFGQAGSSVEFADGMAYFRNASGVTLIRIPDSASLGEGARKALETVLQRSSSLPSKFLDTERLQLANGEIVPIIKDRILRLRNPFKLKRLRLPEPPRLAGSKRTSRHGQRF